MKNNLVEEIRIAQQNLKGIVQQTPLQFNERLSALYNADIYLKREDLQAVRSYKIRGAYNRIQSLNELQRNQGVVCASAGNHAQGVAWSCRKLGIKGTIFMPATTPRQKVGQVELFGRDSVEIMLTGDTFDDAFAAASDYARNFSMTFVHPFDDEMIIAGQGTIALEILEELKGNIDVMLFPVGGGGLAAGLCSAFNVLAPNTDLVGVEPAGAPSMKAALEHGHTISIDHIDKFVDGAAVKKVGSLNFKICQPLLNQMLTVEEGRICTTILSLYNGDGIVAEPAGALSIAALEQVKEQIEGKTVVCILSGGNNDISRTEEIRERSLLFEGLKHYFLIEFPQRPGALKSFVSDVLGPDDDITYFQFAKKNNRESGPAVVGIEVLDSSKRQSIQEKLDQFNFRHQYLNDNLLLLNQLIH